MSLGTNLQFLRKRQGLTQEEFAEKLQVSRQTVSKWESDASFPEMDKLLQLCEMFGCDMDTLTRGNAEASIVEDTAGYNSEMNKYTASICGGTALVLLGVTAMLLLVSRGVNEVFAMMIMMTFILVAVALFIVSSLRHGDYVRKHPYIRPFYAKEKVDRFDRRFSLWIAAPTVLILLGIIWLMGIQMFPYPEGMSVESFELLCTGVFMLVVTIAAPMYIYGGMQKYKYSVEKYNQSNAHSKENERQERITGAVCGAIMLLATIAFLVMGWGWELWRQGWIAFAVGGILCGVASMVISAT